MEIKRDCKNRTLLIAAGLRRCPQKSFLKSDVVHPVIINQSRKGLRYLRPDFGFEKAGTAGLCRDAAEAFEKKPFCPFFTITPPEEKRSLRHIFKHSVMKVRSLLIFLSIGLCTPVFSQTQSPTKIQPKMKLNAGIITSKIKETKDFYVNTLGFGVTFENDFYLLLHTPNHESEISFLLPNHPSQQALFHKPFQGQGMYVTIEVDDVDKVYNDIKSKKVAIKIDIRDESWGDRHFAIEDPNGVAIDIVKYSPSQEN